MTTKEQVLAILKEVKPAKDLAETQDIIEGGYIDSFELMLLISRLSETFGAEITVEEMTPENFNSADAIAAMMDTLAKK